ncbi:MAG: DUF4238 domain-containing protein, partial [Ureaplasma sp.]|nr:DUF4238 domain-containing protein [Ureaplasma sp.]
MSYKNNHFIQKAYAKNWADENGNIKYARDYSLPLEVNTFNIQYKNELHPISKQYFYSKNVEKGMNEIESDGIAIINKIKDIKQNSLTLNRLESFTIRCFCLLSSLRTEKLRNNYKDKTGDSLFNHIVQNSGMESSEIQEHQIKQLIRYYKSLKHNLNNPNSKIDLDYLKNFDNPIKCLEDSIDGIFTTNLHNIKWSTLIFVRFKSNNLLLMEANTFCEYYPKLLPLPGQPIMYHFFTLTPSLGVIAYDIRMLNSYPKYNSKIFKNNLRDNLPSSHRAYEDNFLKEDLFTYNVIDESEDVACFCNAMMMVHNKSSLILFKNKNDVIDALNKIKLENIYRIEDT